MQADFPKELEEVGTVMASSKILGKPYSKEDLPAGRYEERSEEFSCK